MVRGGGYGSGAGATTGARYNSSNTSGRRTAGVRSWARARFYSKNVPGTPIQRYNTYYYKNGRATGNAGAAASSGARRGRNFAIIRGRYSTPFFVSTPAGPYRYFRGSRGGGYMRGGAVVGNGRSATAATGRPTQYRGNRGEAGTAAAGVRATASVGKGRGSRGGGGVNRAGGGGVSRGGGVRGFARGAFRRRERGSSFFRGRGRGRGTGFGRGGRGGASAGLNKEALDAELDKYMGDDNIKKRLDSDLEKYFSRSGGGGGASGANTAGNAATGGGEQGAGVVGGAGPGAAVSSVVDPAVGAGPATAGAGGGAGDATTNGTLKPPGSMDVSMDNSL